MTRPLPRSKRGPYRSEELSVCARFLRRYVGEPWRETQCGFVYGMRVTVRRNEAGDFKRWREHTVAPFARRVPGSGFGLMRRQRELLDSAGIRVGDRFDVWFEGYWKEEES